MDEIVIGHRAPARILAILPAAVVVLVVRALTVFHASVPLRAVGAGAIALASWWAYRLLTARVVIADAGVHVRGVWYDADIAWTDLEHVDLVPSGRGLQLLLFGIMRPQSLMLRAGARTLHPVGAVSGHDDEDIDRAIHTIRTRAVRRRVPAQRSATESVTSV